MIRTWPPVALILLLTTPRVITIAYRAAFTVLGYAAWMPIPASIILIERPGFSNGFKKSLPVLLSTFMDLQS